MQLLTTTGPRETSAADANRRGGRFLKAVSQWRSLCVSFAEGEGNESYVDRGRGRSSHERGERGCVKPSDAGRIGTAPCAASTASRLHAADIAPLPADGKFQVVSETSWSGDKVRVFWLGALFCPFCAAERWSLVSALERFGTLNGYTADTHQEGLAGFWLVPTPYLRKSIYTSQYLNYSGKEIFDRDNAPLDTLDAEEQAIINRFDPEAKFPFLMINGQYVQFDSGFSPGLIDQMDFDTLRGQLASGELNDATNAIIAEADLITRYLCNSTGGRPVAACTT
jgi:hypothetical protein